MRDIKTLSQTGLVNIRTQYNHDGEPLFCLKDVCEALQTSNPVMARKLSWRVKCRRPVLDRLGRVQYANFVTSRGMIDTMCLYLLAKFN